MLREGLQLSHQSEAFSNLKGGGESKVGHLKFRTDLKKVFLLFGSKNLVL